MATHTGTSTTRRATRRGVVALVVPPVAWTASLYLSYVVQDFTCSSVASAGGGVAGGALSAVLIGLNVVLLLATVVAGLTGLAVARHAGRGAGLLPFLGYVGAAAAVVFGYSIVLLGLTPVVLGVC
ncbi:hypothetical protein GCM10023169_35670 [Georgenia halophila]|uniref:Integral membrane protein n=1 Tax=Georgenia halophila TaxID=620889 RepID=A0ABP8LLF4_9MICO